ncbi:membrane metallo-endopeptidase-like 1 [Haemaphysalis longicornis]
MISASFCLLLLALLLILVSFIIITKATSSPTESQPSSTIPSTTATQSGQAGDIVYCDSDYCNREADYLSSLLSASKKTCDNFYEHVCEAWTKAHTVKGTGAGGGISTDTLIQDALTRDLAPLLDISNRKDVQLAASLRRACADRNKANTGLDRVQDLYKGWKIGQWPRTQEAGVADVWTYAGQLVRDLGLEALVRVSLVRNPRGSAAEATLAELNKPRFIFSCNDASRQSVTRTFRMALRDLAAEISQSAGDALLDEVMAAFVRLGSTPLVPAMPDTDATAAYVAKLSDLDPGYRNLLGAAFDRVDSFDSAEATVVVRSSDYVRHFLATAMRELRPRATLNYLGFLVLVQLAPFLPDKFASLRQLFAKSVRGRTFEDVSDTQLLCLMAVERVLPACFSRILSEQNGNEREDTKERVRQLERIFSQNLAFVSWVDEARAVLARYQLRRSPALHFGFDGDSCSPPGLREEAEPVLFYRDVARGRQKEEELRAQQCADAALTRTVLSTAAMMSLCVCGVK